MKKRKIKTIAFPHKVDGRSRNLLIVSTVGIVDAISAVTFRGAKLDLAKRKKYWRWQRKFPFLTRKELGIYTTTIQPKRE